MPHLIIKNQYVKFIGNRKVDSDYLLGKKYYSNNWWWKSSYRCSSYVRFSNS